MPRQRMALIVLVAAGCRRTNGPCSGESGTAGHNHSELGLSDERFRWNREP
jgi:hypothetical protein